MKKTSIHIIPVKLNSEIHNKRLKEYDYVRKELSHLNESWEVETLEKARKRINETYTLNTGQKMQKKATPLREGVVVISEKNTMQDLQKLAEAFQQKFGIKTIQIYIHRDEGHMRTKDWKPNLHAHMVFDWTDEKGKSIKLNRAKMSEMQDLVSDVLKMERGQRSNKKHLNAIEFKLQAKEKELAEKIQKIKDFEKKLKELQEVINPKMSLSDFEEKGVLGAKRLSKEKIEEFIQAMAAQNALYKKMQEEALKSNDDIRKLLQLLKIQNSEKEMLQDRMQKAEEWAKELQRKLDFPSDAYLFQQMIAYEKREKENFNKAMEAMTQEVQKNFLKYEKILSLDNLYREHLSGISQRKTIWELMNKHYDGGQDGVENYFKNLVEELVEKYQFQEKEITKMDWENEEELKRKGVRR